MAADFFDNLGDKIGSVGKEIGEKAKGVANSTKIHASIAAEEMKIKEHYYQLGRAYYEQFKETPDLEFMDIVDNITRANERIKQYREDLKKEL